MLNLSFFTNTNLLDIQYQYELAIGDQPITAQEWKELVNAKTKQEKILANSDWTILRFHALKQIVRINF